MALLVSKVERTVFRDRCTMESSCVTYSGQTLTIGVPWTPFVSHIQLWFDNQCTMDSLCVTYSGQGLTIGVTWTPFVSHIQVTF